jgi:hypothetical protein
MSDAATPPSSALPDRIAKRIALMRAEVEAIVATANAYRTTVLPDRISFEIRSAVLGRDILSDYERAQSVSFITRCEHFPLDVKVRLVTDTQGNWYIGNLWDLRQALNDFRPVIQNQSDSVFYQNMHNTWSKMLRQQDPSEGTAIRVHDRERNDVTDVYAAWLGERIRALRHIVTALDYGYLYNGFLQHSDPQLSKRLFDDYVSGELNWLLWKHVRPLGVIASLLEPYNRLMRVLTFPSLGAL